MAHRLFALSGLAAMGAVVALLSGHADWLARLLFLRAH